MNVEVKIYRNVPFLVCRTCKTYFPKIKMLIKKDELVLSNKQIQKEKAFTDDEIYLEITCEQCAYIKYEKEKQILYSQYSSLSDQKQREEFHLEEKLKSLQVPYETYKTDFNNYLKSIGTQIAKECSFDKSTEDLLYCGICQKWFCKSCQILHNELAQVEYVYDKESKTYISQHFFIDREINFYTPCLNDKNSKIRLGYYDPKNKKEQYLCDICDYQREITGLEIHPMKKILKGLEIESEKLEYLKHPVNSFIKDVDRWTNNFLEKLTQEEGELSLSMNSSKLFSSSKHLLPSKKEDVIKIITDVKRYNTEINAKILNFFKIVFQNLFFFFTYKLINKSINETMGLLIGSSGRARLSPATTSIENMETAYLRLRLFLKTNFVYGHSASQSYRFANARHEKVTKMLVIKTKEDDNDITETLVTASGKSIKLWRFPFAKESAKIKDSSTSNLTCLITDDYGHLITGGYEKKIWFYTISKKKAIRVNCISVGEPITALFYFKKNVIEKKKEETHEMLLIATITQIHQYDLKTKSIVNKFNIKSDETTLRSFLIILDEKYFLFARNDKVNVFAFTELGLLSNLPFTVHGLNGKNEKAISAMLRLSSGVIVTCSYDRTIKFWQFAKDKFLQNLSTKEFREGFSCLKEINKSKLLSGTINGTICLWSLKRYELLKVYDVNFDFAFCIELLMLDDETDNSNIALCPVAVPEAIEFWVFDIHN